MIAVKNTKKMIKEINSEFNGLQSYGFVELRGAILQLNFSLRGG
ncbi:hypothetical protein ES702_02681 [subsurface metagenome]